jgi:uncharacterized protein (DUF927 family)
MSNKLFSKWFDKQPKETQHLVNDYMANKIKKARDSERERIRLAFVEECEKNNKRYGGSFVDYSFENKVIKKEL